MEEPEETGARSSVTKKAKAAAVATVPLSGRAALAARRVARLTLLLGGTTCNCVLTFQETLHGCAEWFSDAVCICVHHLKGVHEPKMAVRAGIDNGADEMSCQACETAPGGSMAT